MKADKLCSLVKEFVEVAAPMLDVYVGTDTVKLDATSTLAVWMQVPDSSYKSLFLGWLLAKGYDTNSVSAEQLEHAVQVACVGENKNIIFDWLGETVGSTKSH